MKKLIILFTVLLTGCASQPKIIYVPTPVGCEIPQLPPEPRYINLEENATPSDFVKWCLVNYQRAKTDARSCRLSVGN